MTASRDGWIALRREKLGACRVCCDPNRVELHHLIPRSIGGGDVAANLVPLCRTCHDRITRREYLERVGLAESLTDTEYAYVVGKLGEGGMERLFGVGR